MAFFPAAQLGPHPVTDAGGARSVKTAQKRAWSATHPPPRPGSIAPGAPVFRSAQQARRRPLPAAPGGPAMVVPRSKSVVPIGMTIMAIWLPKM